MRRATWFFIAGFLFGGLVDYSQRQDMIIIGGQDGSVIMVTLSPPAVQVIKRLHSPVTDLGFGPEEESLYYSNQAGYLFFHNVDGSLRGKPRKASSPPIYSVSTAYLGDQIIYTSQTPCITKCNYSGGYLIRTMNTPRKINTVVRLSYFGKYIMAGGDDGYLRIYKNEDEHSLLLSMDLGAALSVISFSSDDQHFVVGNDQGTVYVFELFNFNELKREKVHDSKVRFVCFSPDNVYFLSGDERKVYLWNLMKTKTIMNPLWHDSDVIGGGFLPGRDLLYTVTADKQIIFWDRYSLKEKFRLYYSQQSLVCVADKKFEKLTGPKDVKIILPPEVAEESGLYQSLLH